MKKLLLLFCVIIYTFGYSQEPKIKRWYSTADLDLIMHKKIEYGYSYFNTDLNHRVSGEEEINAKKVAFGFRYSFNYMFSRKWSIGVLTGYKSFKRPDFSMVEIGGILKYYFVDTDNVFVYTSLSNQISLNKNQLKSGSIARIGLGVPVLKKEKFNLNLNVFKEQNFFRLNENYALFGLEQERALDIVYRSWGISLGVKF